MYLSILYVCIYILPVMTTFKRLVTGWLFPIIPMYTYCVYFLIIPVYTFLHSSLTVFLHNCSSYWYSQRGKSVPVGSFMTSADRTACEHQKAFTNTYFLPYLTCTKTHFTNYELLCMKLWNVIFVLHIIIICPVTKQNII